jgi:hypothetical protein
MKKYSFLAKMLLGLMPLSKSQKALLKFIIQTVINILAAILTALGTVSCM